MHVFNFYMNKVFFTSLRSDIILDKKALQSIYSVVFARHWKFSKSKEGVGMKLEGGNIVFDQKC